MDEDVAFAVGRGGGKAVVVGGAVVVVDTGAVAGAVEVAPVGASVVVVGTLDPFVVTVMLSKVTSRVTTSSSSAMVYIM